MSDPTFGGTRPLKRVEVVTHNDIQGIKKTSNKVEIQENGVHTHGFHFLSDACEVARKLALEHGLEEFWVDGRYRTTSR